MIQGATLESFGFHIARHVSYVRLRGWFGLLHVAVFYPYFIHIFVTAVVLQGSASLIPSNFAEKDISAMALVIIMCALNSLFAALYLTRARKIRSLESLLF